MSAVHTSILGMLLIHVLWLFSAQGCTPGHQRTFIAGGDRRVVRVGAFDERDPRAPRFGWPGTEARFAFEGAEVSVVLSDHPREDETREADRLSISIDQGPASTLVLKEGKHTYALARGLGAGPHMVRLVKRTETEVGVVTLHGFELARGGWALPAPPRPTRSLLLVGDSISAGYGNEGPNAQCHWSADLQDASRAFPLVAARALGAEATVLAWSGKGVSRNFEARDVGTMPELFYRAVASDDAPVGIRNDPTPDALVVALGTNDFFQSIPNEEVFVAAYLTLLRDLHLRAPRAPTFLVIGPMLLEDYPHPQSRTLVRQWLEQIAKRERAAGRVVTIVEQWTDPAEGVGCDFHPNVRTHERLGRELAEVIRSTMGC